MQPSFIPDQARRELRDLSRTNTTLIDEHSATGRRLQKVLENMNLELNSIATDILRVSGRAILEARLKEYQRFLAGMHLNAYRFPRRIDGPFRREHYQETNQLANNESLRAVLRSGRASSLKRWATRWLLPGPNRPHDPHFQSSSRSIRYLTVRTSRCTLSHRSVGPKGERCDEPSRDCDQPHSGGASGT